MLRLTVREQNHQGSLFVHIQGVSVTDFLPPKQGNNLPDSDAFLSISIQHFCFPGEKAQIHLVQSVQHSGSYLCPGDGLASGHEE